MGRRSERRHETLHERSQRGHRQADDIEVVAVDRVDERRAARPGSRSRRRGPRHSPVATYAAICAASSGANVTSVRSVRSRIMPSGAAIASAPRTSCVRPCEIAQERRGLAASAGLP